MNAGAARGGGSPNFRLTGSSLPPKFQRVIRALLAASLALFLVFAAGGHHVHAAGPHGADHCAVCAVRSADVAHHETPDVAPRPVLEDVVEPARGLAPALGAPLGAIPGQSPPRHA